MVQRMRPRRAPPQVLTLDGLGAGGFPLRVVRIVTPAPELPQGPLISTYFMVFVFTAGKGRGRHLEQVDLRAGDIHIIPPGITHEPLDIQDLEGWLVAFDPTLLSSLESASSSKTQRDITDAPVRSAFLRGLLCLRPGLARRQRIGHLIAEIDTELRAAQWGAETVARALFTVFVTEIKREMLEHAPLVPPMLSGLVHDALAFIEAHCLEPLSLQDVAAAVGRTSSHVANEIRRETGLTVGDWLREHRMSEARRRLVETDASMETIADQVGYADVTHFIRTFRRVHGITPRVFREQQRRPAI